MDIVYLTSFKCPESYYYHVYDDILDFDQDFKLSLRKEHNFIKVLNEYLVECIDES